MPLINAHAGVYSEARCLNNGLSLHLHLYLVYASNKALISLCICPDLPEHSLLTDAISTKFTV